MFFSREKYKVDSVYRNQISAYVNVVSSIISGILTLPLIIHYLNQEELGVWALITQMMLFLMLMDFGVAATTGRMMADGMLKNDSREVNEWWSLCIGVITVLAIIMLIIGISITQLFFNFYNITGSLREKSTILYIGTVIIFAFKMPTRMFPSILASQNRFHWVSINHALFGWLRLVTLWICLYFGLGLLSYLLVESILLIANVIGYTYAVRKGGLRVKLVRFEIKKIKRLFSFGSSLGLVCLCNTVINAIPTVLAGRYLGVATVPIFTITNRLPAIVKSFVTSTMHSYYPSFQRNIIDGEERKGEAILNKAMKMSIITALVLGLGVLCLNRSIITLMGDAKYYGGIGLTLALIVLSISFVFIEGSLFSLQALGKMKKISLVVTIEAILVIFLSYFAVKNLGIIGPVIVISVVPLFTRVAYGYIIGVRVINLNFKEVFKGVSITLGIALSIFALAAFILEEKSDVNSWLPNYVELGIATAAGLYLITMLKSKTNKLA